MDRQVRLFPDPLSPIKPKDEPAASSNETPWMTSRCRVPCPNLTRRSSTARLSLARIDPPYHVGQAVPDQAKEQAHHDDGQAREGHHPPRRGDEIPSIGNHHSPLR